jgi:hypothetical protein
VCLQLFHTLKKALISAPVIQPPDWHLSFEIMCDVSDYVVGTVLGQSKDKKHYAISYTSKMVTRPQLNYAMTEKELLATVFAIEKFRSYSVGAKVSLYRSCRFQVSLDEERCKTTPDPMDTYTSRI